MFFYKKSKMDYIEYFKSLPSSIVYTDDKDYRNAIRKVFRFEPNKKYTYDGKLQNYDDLDEISKDELLMDSESITTSMDALYNATKNENVFQDLYLKAAGRMFSTDPSIGHAVMCSYDTFYLYHSCVWYYLHGGIASLLTIHEFEQLQQYFQN